MGRPQAPTLLGIRDYDSNIFYLFVFCQDKKKIIFSSFAKIRMTNISAFPRIEMTLMGMIEILVCFQYFKYSEQDNEDPRVLYSDHYVANLSRFSSREQTF